MLPTRSLLSSVTESTPSSFTRAPPTPSIHLSLWALETDDTYEPLILAASPLVQSISFPERQDISFDTSILQPTASVYTSQEQSRTEYDYQEPFERIAIDYLFLFLFSNTNSNCIRIISVPCSYGPLPFVASFAVHDGGNTVTVS